MDFAALAGTDSYRDGRDLRRPGEPRFEPNATAKAGPTDYKADLKRALAESISTLGIGDSREWYKRIGKATDITGVGATLDAASATKDWWQGDGPSPGLPIAEALSGAMFVGPLAKVGRMEPLKKFYDAKQLEDRGALNSEIWEATGWLRAPDKKWRREIDDSGSFFHREKLQEAADAGRTLKMSEAFDHPELFQAYPRLGQGNVGIAPLPSSSAMWTPQGDMVLDAAHAAQLPQNELRGLFLHELQHGVQDIEKFASGGNPDGVNAAANALGFSSAGPAAVDLYRRLMGEIEARDTQFRRGFDMPTRRQISPYESQVGDTYYEFGDWFLPRVRPEDVITTEQDLIRALEALNVPRR